MADIDIPYEHKEIRLNLESTIPGSTVAIRLPSHGIATWSSRTAQKRPLPVDIPPSEDESAFKQRHLASAASIYYRQYHQYPRGLLWRVLEDGKVLSIQVADLCKQEKTIDAHLTLRLSFPSPIRPSCVVFADSKEHDIVSVSVLTESNHLYTLTLRPEFFRRRSSTEDNVGDWCKTYLSSAFGFKHPHRLVAISSEQLLASLSDGGLLKLERVPGEDSSVWKETFYNEGGWTHGLRSLIPFQGSHTVRYGKVNLELSAVTAIASPSSLVGGIPYAFTVSLDHRLRVWNLSSGRIAYSGDLLDEERLPNDIGKYAIHPSQSQLVKVYENIEGKALAVTYSPTGAGQFKFWVVSQGEEQTLELEDILPDVTLVPPTPTSDLWTLADFSAAIDKRDHHRVTLWALWKNNITYRVHKLNFQLDSTDTARTSWEENWTAVAEETLADAQLPIVSSLDHADCTEKWLDYILFPGRYTTATIETALAIYERGLGASRNPSLRNSKNLAQRMCSLVASSSNMDRNSDGQMEYDKYRAATDTQWRRFYRLILELDKQRGEALSLAFDTDNQMAWVVTADGLSAVRECSAMERLCHSPASVISGQDKAVAVLVTAASALRESFPDGFSQACNTTMTNELFRDPSIGDSDALRNLYEKCNLAGQIGDEDYSQLLANLGGSLRDLSFEVFESLLATMTAAEEFDARLERLPLAALGRKTIVRGVEETVELHRSICFDQLVLLMFIEVEIDQDAEEMHLDTVPIFNQLVVMLKRLEMLSWLFKTEISTIVPRVERSSPTKKAEEMKTITVLEGCINHLLGLVAHSGESTASLLTEILIRICDPEGEYELQPAIIQCFLLKLDRPDLALEFARFRNQDPFSTYVQGRAFLALKDLSTAAMYFTKAAFGLAHPDPRISTDRHSSGLLDDTEWNLLYAGLPKYYCHIVSLYDKEKYYSFVIDFARIGLQFASASSKEKSVLDLRTELHSRLFNAALQTSRFDVAYSTLTQFMNNALQLSSLRSLIFRMCELGSASELMDLPFLGLQGAVDDILAQKCQTIVDVNANVPYHKILYAWRIKRNDFRGAATVSLERLQKLQQSGSGDKIFVDGPGTDGLETPVTQQYLTLINALSCIDPKQAWILSEPLPNKSTSNGIHSASTGKRQVVTLEDARRGYQEELDRLAAIENNQFSFVGSDEMDLV